VHVRMKPRPHTHTKFGLRFLSQKHTSYKWGYNSATLHKDVSQGAVSGKKTNNNPGLCPITG